jgi:hypothetical protein
MLRTYMLSGALVLAIGGHLQAQSQSGAGAAEQRPGQPAAPATASSTNQSDHSVTLSGCLYRERDVPGRTPNVAERAGVLEDYILTDAKIAKAQSSGGESPHASTATMYKVENIDDEKLRALVGKRVEVMGKIDAEAGDSTRKPTTSTDRSVGPDRINLPEFEATSIKEVTGTCPATPSTSR